MRSCTLSRPASDHSLPTSSSLVGGSQVRVSTLSPPYIFQGFGQCWEWHWPQSSVLLGPGHQKPHAGREEQGQGCPITPIGPQQGWPRVPTPHGSQLHSTACVQPPRAQRHLTHHGQSVHRHTPTVPVAVQPTATSDTQGCSSPREQNQHASCL
jgi:hypothetical protein